MEPRHHTFTLPPVEKPSPHETAVRLESVVRVDRHEMPREIALRIRGRTMMNSDPVTGELVRLATERLEVETNRRRRRRRKG